eukprot:SAG31_NODE_677_length_12894_cov_4.083548_13_plen_607_part_00
MTDEVLTRAERQATMKQQGLGGVLAGDVDASIAMLKSAFDAFLRAAAASERREAARGLNNHDEAAPQLPAQPIEWRRRVSSSEADGGPAGSHSSGARRPSSLLSSSASPQSAQAGASEQPPPEEVVHVGQERRGSERRRASELLPQRRRRSSVSTTGGDKHRNSEGGSQARRRSRRSSVTITAGAKESKVEGRRRSRRSSVVEAGGGSGAGGLLEAVAGKAGSLRDLHEALGGCTLWVGRIPANVARGEAGLTKLFARFGRVISVTIRRKEEEGAGLGGRRSWAFVTFAEPASVKAALSAKLICTDDVAQAEVVLLTRRAAVESEMAKQSTGMLARTWANQESKLAAAIKIQAAVRGFTLRKGDRGDKRRRRSSLRKVHETVATLEEADGEEEDPETLPLVGSGGDVQEEAAEEEGGAKAEAFASSSSSNSVNVSRNSASSSDGCTLWVGSVPRNMVVAGPGPLAELFGQWGGVVGVTCRQKTEAGTIAAPKNWALVTMDSADAATAALLADVTCLDDANIPVVLDVRGARVNEELAAAKGGGALERVWEEQQLKVEAAVKIQAAVRGFSLRQHGGRHRRRSSVADSDASKGRGGGRRRRSSRSVD